MRRLRLPRTTGVNTFCRACSYFPGRLARRINTSNQMVHLISRNGLQITWLNTPIFAAALSGLQVDANARADKASRDSQEYALLAAHELERLGHQSNYDLKLFVNTINYAQQATVMELTALELEQDREEESAAKLRSQLQIAQERSDTGAALSLLYTDARYAPTEPGDIPDLEAYLENQKKLPTELTKKQNAASDQYHRWDKKADPYIAVLSILAIAFFLLGLAQSAAHMRLFFAFSGLVAMSLAAVWTGFILIS